MVLCKALVDFCYLQARSLKHPGKQFAPLVLLPGETLILQQENVTCVGTLTNLATGVLYLSCYRLVFKGTFFQVFII